MTASLVCLRRAQNRRRSENPCSSLHESNHNHIGKSYPPGACGAHIKREYDDMDRDATLGAVELFVRHGLEVQIPRLAGLYCEICSSSYQNDDTCRQHTKPISTISTETTPSYTFSEKVGKTEASTHHHRAKQKPQPSKEPATATYRSNASDLRLQTEYKSQICLPKQHNHSYPLSARASKHTFREDWAAIGNGLENDDYIWIWYGLWIVIMILYTADQPPHTDGRSP